MRKTISFYKTIHYFKVFPVLTYSICTVFKCYHSMEKSLYFYTITLTVYDNTDVTEFISVENLNISKHIQKHYKMMTNNKQKGNIKYNIELCTAEVK